MSFSLDDLEAAGISSIEKFIYRYNTSDTSDSEKEDRIPGEVILDNLNITY